MSNGRRLEVLNARPAAEWERFKRVPRALIPIEHSINPCIGCRAHCCHHILHLSAFEAVRIACVLTLPPEEFVDAEAWTRPDRDIGVPVLHPIRTDAGPVRLRLKQQEDKACAFLYSIAGKGRCGAYAARPGVCRIYPFEIEDEIGRVRVGTTDYCEQAWLFDDDTVAGLERSVADWRADLSRDRELVARWNRGTRAERSLGAFYRWAVAELADELGGDLEAIYPPPRRTFGSRLKRD
jgi:Fe-S-cluster containining protein